MTKSRALAIAVTEMFESKDVYTFLKIQSQINNYIELQLESIFGD